MTDSHATHPAFFETERLLALTLTPSTAPLLQRVFEAAGDHFLPITGRAEPEPDAAQRELDSCARTPGRETALLLLREGGEPVGALGWWAGNPAPDLALLGMLLLVPDARGRGLAREALAALEAGLAADGLRSLRTGIGAGDTRAHALLAALGFQPLDERTHVSLERGRIMISLFEKPLAPADG
jgi:RimJ/RimL family protein N-acetyltransferase